MEYLIKDSLMITQKSSFLQKVHKEQSYYSHKCPPLIYHNNHLQQQECIPVGCVPSAAVAAGGCLPRGCLHGGVSAQGLSTQREVSALGMSALRVSAWAVSAEEGVCPSACWDTPSCEQND